MSQHRSLRADRKGGHYRNVLKRWEKIKRLMEKDKWDKEEDSVFNLPKIKRIKMKIKKKKTAVAEKEEVGKEVTAKPEKEIAEDEEEEQEK